MCPMSFNVWFVCKCCTLFFPKVDEFIEHKKENHFTEFKWFRETNNNCIVFEESTIQYTYTSTVLSSAEPAPVVKEEIQLTNEFTSIEATPQVPGQSSALQFIPVKVEPSGCSFDYDSNLTGSSKNSESFKNAIHSPFIVDQKPSFEINSSTTNSMDSETDPFSSCLLEPKSELIIYDYDDESLVNLDHAEDPSTQQHKSGEESKSKSTPKNRRVSISNSGASTSQSDLQCKLCSVNLKSEAELKIHTENCALNHPQRNRYCVSCNIKFCSAQATRFHRLRFHATAEEKSSMYKHECSICSKKYSQKTRLQIHLESHKSWEDRVRPFQCQLCPAAFFRKDTLNIHFKSHGVKL